MITGRTIAAYDPGSYGGQTGVFIVRMPCEIRAYAASQFETFAADPDKSIEVDSGAIVVCERPVQGSRPEVAKSVAQVWRTIGLIEGCHKREAVLITDAEVRGILRRKYGGDLKKSVRQQRVWAEEFWHRKFPARGAKRVSKHVIDAAVLAAAYIIREGEAI